MEVEEIQAHGCKFQRIGINGRGTRDFNKLGQENEEDGELKEEGGSEIGGGGVARLYGWPTSRIVRVSRATGGKDRHSKVWTSKGLRDRRVRLSVTTAIQFYDLQDRLGYDQPSKAVEWLLKAAATSIDELPTINTSFPNTPPKQLSDEKRSSELGLDSMEFDGDPNYHQQNQNQNQQHACSSTSETSKGSGLCLSRSESRIKARERARERKKEKEKDGENVNHHPITQSSFTQLLTGGINTNTSPNGSSSAHHQQNQTLQWSSTAPMDYFAPSRVNPSSGFAQIHHLGSNSLDHHQELQQFSFMPDHFIPTAAASGGGGGGADYNLDFTISSGLAGSFNRGTLQSKYTPSMPPHLQRLSNAEGSNVPFFIAENHHHHHQFPAGHSDQKGKGKN